METVAKVRRLYHKDGLSQRAIALKLHLSRRTVRKYLECTEEPTYQRQVQPYPQLGEYRERLEARLLVELPLSKSKRLSAQRHFEWLKSIGYQGAYGAVCGYIRTYYKTHHQPVTAFIPQRFTIADAYQFDWSTEQVRLAGVVIKVQVAHFRLCYSRGFFIRAYPSQKIEMLMDAHNHAFTYFGGTPQRGIYDNMKTAVKSIGSGKDREFNDQFMGMMNHFLIEPVACTPASGWEKGQVERQVQTLRKKLFEPMLAFETLEELNRYLYDQCKYLITQMLHPEDRSQTVDVYLTQERQYLDPCQPYPASRIELVRANTLSLVSYDAHRYSIPCEWAGQQVALHITATEIKVVVRNQIIAIHPRSFLKNQATYNPWHYMKALERKPGALRNGEPFEHWPLPKSIKTIQKHLLKQPKGDRAMVRLLSLIADYGEELGVTAAELALEEGIPTVEAVLNIIHRLQEPPIPDIPAFDVPLKIPPLAQLHRFDSLLSQEVRHAAS